MEVRREGSVSAGTCLCGRVALGLKAKVWPLRGHYCGAVGSVGHCAVFFVGHDTQGGGGKGWSGGGEAVN